jgi:hypothetical protein
VAIRLVVYHAERLNRDGVMWRSISVAVGVSVTSLRRWRITTPPRSTPPTPMPTRLTFLPVTPPPSGLRIRPIEPIPIRQEAGERLATEWQHPLRAELAAPRVSVSDVAPVRRDTTTVFPVAATRRVLIATGDAQPGSNRFDKEVATIRKALELSVITVIERTCVDPSEITRHLSAHRPTVLHLSAHSAYGAIGLAVDGQTHWIDQNLIRIALTQGPAPRLTVLNICASQMLANALIGWCPAVLYWPGVVDDDQARKFSDALYRSFAIGMTIAKATASSLPVCGEVPPRLLGDTHSRIF